MREYLSGFLKFKPLLKELVIRDVKVRYRKSFLGLLWTLLNPLFMMIIMTIVFSNIFRANIEYFPAYLLAGQICFNFFNESTNNAMSAIIGNGSLIKKVYVPKYLFPISKVFSTLINLAASVVVLIAVMLVTRVPLNGNAVWIIVPLIGLIFFSVGLGLILSSVAVFFRDMLHFYGVITLALSYLTPLFYPVDILPDTVRKIVTLNPLTNIVECVRVATLYGSMPEPMLMVASVVPGMILLVFGFYTFYRSQDKFILYL